MHRRLFHISLLTVGASSVATQLVMVREFMAVFGGNELVVGVVLGVWLLFGGMGSRLGGAFFTKKSRPEPWLLAGHLALAMLPLFQLAALRGLPLLWVRGQMLGFGTFLASATLLLFPYAFVSGAMLPLAGCLVKSRKSTVRVFVTDTVGDIFGGVAFGLFLVWLLSHWQTLVFFGFFHLAAALAAAHDKKRASCKAILLLMAVLAASLAAEGQTRQWRFSGQEILDWENTPFSQLAVTRLGNQYNVWQDGILLYSSNDPATEALVHPALCLAPRRPKVLLLAGGVFGSLREIQKHHPEKVDYVELDPAILDLDPLIFNSLQNSNVVVHLGDGRLFVKKAKERYDAILVDLPSPENAQLNRFYTVEFFREIQRILSPGGLFCFTLDGAENYMEKRGLALNQTVFAALKSVFPHVLALPGPTHYFLASRRPLDSTLIESRLTERSIATLQLADYDLATMADPFRIDSLALALGREGAVPNKDLSPRAFGRMMELWMEKTQSSRLLYWLLAAGVLLACVLAWSGDPARLTLLTSGYAGMGMELCLVLLFQVVWGYAYVVLCLYVTLFLMGSAAGGLVMVSPKRKKEAWVRTSEAGLVLVAAACLAAALAGPELRTGWGLGILNYLALPGCILGAGFFTGSQFGAVAGMMAGSDAQITGRLYLADLAGACLGSLVLGLALLPALGIVGVLLTVLLVKVANFLANPFVRATAKQA